MQSQLTEMLWLRDLLEHLNKSQEQLECLRDPCSVHYLTQQMLRELEVCRRLTMKLNKHATLTVVN